MSEPTRNFVVFDGATGDALWLKRDSDWPSLPSPELSLAEFSNIAWEDAVRAAVVVDLASRVWRDGDLPLVALRPAPNGHAVALVAREN